MTTDTVADHAKRDVLEGDPPPTASSWCGGNTALEQAETAPAGMVRSRRLEQTVEQIDEIDMEDCEPPEDLERRVRKALEKYPTIRWDAAVQQIAERAAK